MEAFLRKANAKNQKNGIPVLFNFLLVVRDRFSSRSLLIKDRL